MCELMCRDAGIYCLDPCARQKLCKVNNKRSIKVSDYTESFTKEKALYAMKCLREYKQKQLDEQA